MRMKWTAFMVYSQTAHLFITSYRDLSLILFAFILGEVKSRCFLFLLRLRSMLGIA